MLSRLRRERGWSQPRLADRLCSAAGVATVSRNEISRWERELRTPGPFWLGWLAIVLDTPLDRLAGARPAASGTVSTAGGTARTADEDGSTADEDGSRT